jgi:hypothetical protein
MGAIAKRDVAQRKVGQTCMTFTVSAAGRGLAAISRGLPLGQRQELAVRLTTVTPPSNRLVGSEGEPVFGVVKGPQKRLKHRQRLRRDDAIGSCPFSVLRLTQRAR